MNIIKKIFATVLVILIIIHIAPTTAYAISAEKEMTVFSDMPENWSTVALENAIENGLLNGSDGMILPNAHLTRAQMATMITRAFGASREGDLKSFSDVKQTDWYGKNMAVAVQMGVIKGTDGKLNPNEAITRQECFVVLARAFKLQEMTTINIMFSDENEISEWAKGAVYALVNSEVIQGSNGRINPKDYITRAEVAQIFDNLIEQYINEPGEYIFVERGNIMVNTPGVTLEDLSIEGDLIIGDGVGDGEVILDHVEVTGRMVVRGGGVNSIIIRGSSNITNLIVARVDGAVSIKVEGDANVQIIYIDDDSEDIHIEGNVGRIDVQASSILISTAGAQIRLMNFIGENVRVFVDETSLVDRIDIQKAASNLGVEVKGKVTTISTVATNTRITGQGSVSNVEVLQGGSSAVIETPNTEIKVDRNVIGVVGGGGILIEEGTTISNNRIGTGTISTSRENRRPYVAISDLSLTPAAMTLEKGGTNGLITETITPANTTNKNIIWSSSNETIATVIDGVVTPTGIGTATITATSRADRTKSATTVVNVIPIDVSSISMTPEVIITSGNQTLIITETILPTNATNKDVIWSSNNEVVATIENGHVSAVSQGLAIITATTVDGSKTATTLVNVVSAADAHAFWQFGDIFSRYLPATINEIEERIDTSNLDQAEAILLGVESPNSHYARMVEALPSIPGKEAYLEQYAPYTDRFQELRTILTELELGQEKEHIESANYIMTQEHATDETSIKSEIESILAGISMGDEVVATVNKVVFIPAVAGDVDNPIGTNGTYTFTVVVSKNSLILHTETLTMAITATPFID